MDLSLLREENIIFCKKYLKPQNLILMLCTKVSIKSIIQFQTNKKNLGIVLFDKNKIAIFKSKFAIFFQKKKNLNKNKFLIKIFLIKKSKLFKNNLFPKTFFNQDGKNDLGIHPSIIFFPNTTAKTCPKIFSDIYKLLCIDYFN